MSEIESEAIIAYFKLICNQFYITTRENLDYLDGKHTIFGHVVEGMDTLEKINNAYTDKVFKQTKENFYL